MDLQYFILFVCQTTIIFWFIICLQLESFVHLWTEFCGQVWGGNSVWGCFLTILWNQRVVIWRRWAWNASRSPRNININILEVRQVSIWVGITGLDVAITLRPQLIQGTLGNVVKNEPTKEAKEGVDQVEAHARMYHLRHRTLNQVSTTLNNL